MSLIIYNDHQIEIDNDGFLVDWEAWSQPVARALAEAENVGELTESRLDILKFLREYYEENRFFPILRFVCKSVHQQSKCVTDQFQDPVKAWKIAGLPNPGEEVLNFKSWEPLGY
jgi:TusE/DsrC/DsvC family sulfur relay protein